MRMTPGLSRNSGSKRRFTFRVRVRVRVRDRARARARAGVRVRVELRVEEALNLTHELVLRVRMGYG